jgi:hypothetical protein
MHRSLTERGGAADVVEAPSPNAVLYASEGDLVREVSAFASDALTDTPTVPLGAATEPVQSGSVSGSGSGVARVGEAPGRARLAEPEPISSAVGGNSELWLMARVLGGLFFAGGTLALLSVLLPGPRGGNHAALVGIVANAYLVSAALLHWAGRVPRPLLRVALGWGTTLITGVAYFSGTHPSPLIFFYLWIYLYSAYFFTKRQAAAQLAYCGLAYGMLLVIAPPQQALTWWIVSMGTLLVAAALIWEMRERAEALIARLFDVARTTTHEAGQPPRLPRAA